MCLLNAEYSLSGELRVGLTNLEGCLQKYQTGRVTQPVLAGCLRSYLRRFAWYGSLVGQILDAKTAA